MVVIELEITFDFVCAWCFVYKRNLDAAIDLYRKTYPGGKFDVFKISYTPYYLDYNPHPHAVEKLALADVILADRTPEQRAALTERMNAAGRAAGIIFDWGGKLGPGHATRDAHRLVRLVGRKYGAQMQGALVEAVMEAYHCRAEDVAEQKVLKDAAMRAGLDAADVEGWLKGDEAGEEVDGEAERSRAAGTGVPVLGIQGGRAEGVRGVMDLLQLIANFRGGREDPRAPELIGWWLQVIYGDICDDQH